jgi:hypothetical protein
MTRPHAGHALYLDALLARLEAGPTPENWSLTRRAIAVHLQEYLRGTTPAVDREIAGAILAAIEQAEAKETPELFTPLPRIRGESPNTAATQACIASAGTYVLFCHKFKGKPGVDLAPVRTVAEAFGVTQRTASSWKKRGSLVSKLELYAYVKAGMQAAAKQYPRFGGAGAKAVRKRARGEVA